MSTAEDPQDAEDLRRTFLALHRQFQHTLAVALRARRDASDSNQLASWALRIGPTGWALVRDGAVRITNRSFDIMDRGSVIGPRWHEVSPGSWAAINLDEPGRTLMEVLADMTRVMVRERVAIRRCRLVRADKAVDVIVERAALDDERGMAIGVVRDVSDLYVAETHLADLQSRLVERERAGVASDLAVGVAHDLGNLVGALTAQLMVLDATGTVPVETINAMRTIVDAQLALVGKLTSIGRRHDEIPQRLRWSDVVRPAVQVVNSWLGGRGRRRPVWIRIDSEVEELPPLRGRLDDLVNVVINLLLNARDAMPEGGLVRIAGLCQDRWSSLRVEDQGTGIAPEQLTRIFDPFFTTKGKGGMGMGLATARQTLLGLGGDIRASNRPEGGARFELSLPIDTGPAAPERASGEPGSVPTSPDDASTAS